MLRSSSTPVLGSLLPSISPENPNHHNHHHHHHHNTILHPHKSSSIHKTPSTGSHHFTTLSCHSSPISPSFRNRGIRRAQSDGNFESLMCSGGSDDDAFGIFNPPKRLSSRPHCSLMETIPSFSCHNSRFEYEGDETGNDEEHEESDDGVCGFSGGNIENKVLSLNEQMGFGNLERKDDVGDHVASQMYRARGIGVVDSGFCGGGGGDAGRKVSLIGGGEEGGNGGGVNNDVEEQYRKMVNEAPGNSLLLGNYARFLYESKQDLQEAEQYYLRAILIDPNDGVILSQFAKLSWELHHDIERVTSYFERAVHVASENSHVHASYAGFLWETEEDEDIDEEGYYSHMPSILNNGTVTSNAIA